ncbi:MAG: YdeI/OmpD-associated family protein [Gemmatimonadota bacterium]
MKPRFFKNPPAFRAWLEKNHEKANELLVGFYKTSSGKPSITWPESVDQALCFGWIDGVRKRIDEETYTIRFTPRRSGSIWSAVNIKRVDQLEKQGLMRPAGLAAAARRSETKSGIYAYEQATSPTLPDGYRRKFQSNRKAWAFFQAQAPWYRRRSIYRIVSARKEETRLRRLNGLIEASSRGEIT